MTKTNKPRVYCVWVRFAEDGNKWHLAATFYGVGEYWTARKLAAEYQESCWTAKRQAKVLPLGRKPR